jgi:hypothetical protein
MLNQDNSSVREPARHLATLHPNPRPEERVEIRFRPSGFVGPMRQEFHPSAGAAAYRSAVLAPTHEVYAGVAPRLGEVGTKAGVPRVQAIWADLDAKGGHTREGRLAQLMDLPCQPSMLVWTGGGYHPYWLLLEAAEGPEEMALAETAMRLLAAGLDGDPVHDRSRVLRVAGTLNHKHGEPRPVVLERCEPELRHDLDSLLKMAESLPGSAASGKDGLGSAPRDVLAGPIRDGGRNVALASVAGSLRDRGLDAGTIGDVLLEVNGRRCAPPLEAEEVLGIVRSVGRYRPGKPRYVRSPVRRLRDNKEGR